jgi:hypothetical protein
VVRHRPQSSQIGGLSRQRNATARRVTRPLRPFVRYQTEARPRHYHHPAATRMLSRLSPCPSRNARPIARRVRDPILFVQLSRRRYSESAPRTGAACVTAHAPCGIALSMCLKTRQAPAINSAPGFFRADFCMATGINSVWRKGASMLVSRAAKARHWERAQPFRHSGLDRDARVLRSNDLSGRVAMVVIW